MGVTLERVQNKFACIIGELCSEPVILSQFAIWVDLRIAEYKAKGAISLDCSGEDPEPGWLNGHRLHRKNESRDRMVARTPVRKSLSRPMGHPSSMHSSPVSLYDQSPASSQVDSDQGFLGETRLSPNLMVIKDEPTDGTASTGVYPTGIHAHGAVTPTRKRPASETVSQADSSFYEQQNTSVHSPSKVQRLSSTGESPHPGDTTSNQSLMSIISGEIDEGNQTAGNLNDRDIDIILDYESKNTFPAQREDNSVSAASRLPEASSSSTADIGDTFSQEGSSNTELNTMSRNNEERQAQDMQIHQSNSPRTNPRPYGQGLHRAVDSEAMPKRLSKASIKARISSADKTQQTIIDVLNSVASIERWMWLRHRETRLVQEVPPHELDAYLVEYFQTLQKPTGEDYKSETFTKLRSCLDRFLRDAKYPASLTKSHVFRRSQSAYDLRRRELVMRQADLRLLQASRGGLPLHPATPGGLDGR
ncbi:uncharacterized protein LOC135463599 isoform X2 [Liolophura sinensis]|uniref:uncharacterized protein LOC135463599 isoform X2 n=1 Tax=Liolophura sinensis TaxID=3198878 RepID=UPI003158B54E